MENQFEGKRILVSGASGFIPSHLCELLLQHGCEVWGIDNFVTGYQDNLTRAKEEYPEKFHFIQDDITDPKVFQDLPRGFSAVLNLASPASPVDFERIPLEILHTGSIGTENMLKVAKKDGARFLQASTSEVYGDPLEHPQKESYLGNVNSFGPRSCYDESKRFAEALVYHYKNKEGVNTGIFRIFNTYGPRMRLDDGRVVPQFMAQALQGKDLTVYGDGSQTRSFCYVDDLTRGIWKLLNSDYYMPVNLGSTFEHSIKEFAEIIIKLSGTDSKITYKPLPKDDPTRRRPDISLAKKALNWEPETDLQTGLTRTMDFFRNKLLN